MCHKLLVVFGKTEAVLRLQAVFFCAWFMDKSVGYSFLTVKAVDEERRIIRGFATTPEPDRDGDIVEPSGIKFRNPSPLLWMHNHGLPVGSVTFGKATKDGLPFEASLPRVSEPSGLSMRIEEAWQSVKAGLVRAVSIGFRPLEYSVIEETGGYRFTSIDLYELSLVSVPANAGATITEIKAFCKQTVASMGSEPEVENKPEPAGEAKKATPVKIVKRKESVMNISEQIKQFRETLAEKKARLVALAEKGATSTFEAAEQEEFDTVTTEIDEVEKHIARLEVAEKAAVASAKPVEGATEKKATESRSNALPATVKAKDNTSDGIGFARLARVKALAFTGQLNTRDEEQIAKALYPNDEKLVGTIQKAAVSAASTLDQNWAGNLINEGGGAFADFVEYLRPRTLYGQISANFRNLPFDAPVLVQSSGGTAQWVKEGEAKPLTQWTYTRAKLSPLKVAAIAAATKETLMRSSVSVDTFLRDELARAVGARIDETLISDDAAVSDESPAGLLNGTAALTLSGGDISGIQCDIAAFLKAMVANTGTISGSFWVMPETVAIALSLARNSLDGVAFPGITPTGGTLAGIPVYTSGYVPTDSAGPVVALIKGDEIFLGDEGGIQVSVSDQASLQFDNAPTQSSVAPTATSSVSLWQTNSVGFLVERFLNFQKRRAGAVVWANVDWDLCS